jgi:hypothetical protein
MSSRGYGTVTADEDRIGASEEESLLPKSSPRHISHRVRKHLAVDLDKKRADLVLLFCYAITGLLDSSAISIWGSFVSMQTGNTVYFALGLGDMISGESVETGGFKWARSGISIASFCLGSFVFSGFHRWCSPTKRWVLCASFAIQMGCIVVAVAIVTIGSARTDTHPLHWTIVVPLALIAFQSSGQAVTSQVLKYNSLTSVVLTSVYCNLFADPDLFKGQNVERNRRATAPVCLLVGGILGGLWAHSSIGLAGALWTAVGFKAIIVVTWLFWKAESDGEGV